jgi:hypothetical protein
VSKYCEIRKWIPDTSGNNPDFDGKFIDFVYTWTKSQNHEWEERLEEVYMTVNNWVYNQEVT